MQLNGLEKGLNWLRWSRLNYQISTTSLAGGADLKSIFSRLLERSTDGLPLLPLRSIKGVIFHV